MKSEKANPNIPKYPAQKSSHVKSTRYINPLPPPCLYKRAFKGNPH